ncbi:unnamed protein product [Gordionus sp. m RMFG-2023]|uniref:protein AF-9-like n=1 Tax=Gordionus sp. m RMFG-2023 TaxID=3053472 RepID=UPI0030E30A4A
MTFVQVKLELGHRAEFRDKPTSNGFTHDWVVFVRGPQDKPIHHFVEKVVFYLHESFNKPRRVVREPPYQIKESGYAGFILPLEVYFKNRDEPKKIRFEYDLFLHLQDCPPVNHVRCEKLTFQNPTPEFQKKLIKAGGVMVASLTTSPQHQNNPSTSLSTNSSFQSKNSSNHTGESSQVLQNSSHTTILNNSTTNLTNINAYNNNNLACTVTTMNHGSSHPINNINKDSKDSGSSQSSSSHNSTFKSCNNNSIVKLNSQSSSKSQHGTQKGHDYFSANTSKISLTASGKDLNNTEDNLSFTSLFGDPIKPGTSLNHIKDSTKFSYPSNNLNNSNSIINSSLKSHKKKHMDLDVSSFNKDKKLNSQHAKVKSEDSNINQAQNYANQSSKAKKEHKTNITNHNISSSSMTQSASNVKNSDNKLVKSIGKNHHDNKNKTIKHKNENSPLFDNDSSDAFDEMKSHKSKKRHISKITNNNLENNGRQIKKHYNSATTEIIIKPSPNIDQLPSTKISSSTLNSTFITTADGNNINLKETDEFDSDISSPISHSEDIANIINLNNESNPRNDSNIFNQIDDIDQNPSNLLGPINNQNNLKHESGYMDNEDTQDDGEFYNGTRDNELDDPTDGPISDNHAEEESTPYSSEFVVEMLNLQKDLMALRDKHLVQRVVDIIVETRKFTISPSTFDFDLCRLDAPTLDRIKNILSLPSSSL